LNDKKNTKITNQLTIIPDVRIKTPFTLPLPKNLPTDVKN